MTRYAILRDNLLGAELFGSIEAATFAALEWDVPGYEDVRIVEIEIDVERVVACVKPVEESFALR